ncbi:hypothetical protein CC1G_08705 [Coprinopsis cinerea okayama7|uniref:Phospholipase/carboxylesterase/thioesterase domain-containing protein n=1 Tax=Coprinopsis cinerea (strain Okayama-7 / 130 / ATCC MYA-4618 / FGSC 9003) TaxID=240176 RepID=A8NZI9_COPC7|nr:hypothetical protein CC1G_08705 [Coprinopsis cinerea okayama7\|eukprot:XP_001837692.1 hypothetical protein CC1G_08705 [Coprinopsis cinerea okayama7\
MSQFHLQESAPDTTPKVKEQPRKNAIPVPFSYYPSDDGTDHNLLILLHGLGAFQWYKSFDQLGDMIENPNPTPALELMKKVIDHLVQDLHWSLNQIHLFGFAQGGSVAAEYALLRWREQLRGQEAGASPPATSFGSLVTVSGSLISYPTIANLSPTPTLVVYRSAPAEDALQPTAVRAFKKGFQSVSEAKLGGNRSGMPASKEEWEPIMKFWSEKLSRRKMDGLYEVMSGMST